MSIELALLSEVLPQQPPKGLMTSNDTKKQHPLDVGRTRPTVPNAYQQRVAQLLTARTQAKIQPILDACADPLVFVDRDGWVGFVNAAACRLLHCQSDDLIGQDAGEFLNYSHADGTPYSAAECPITAALQSGRHSRIDHVLFCRTDGYPVPVTCATRPILEEGRVTGAVISFRDISDRLVLKADYAKKLTEAQQLVTAHSESLVHVSHEIRTSLNAVLGLAQLGIAGAEADRDRQTFSHILEASHFLLEILNNVLDLAKMEAGKLSVHRDPFQPHTLIDQIATQMAVQAEAKGITLRVEKDPNLPETCIGDDVRLRQVLVNLVNNAMKFTSRGTVTLSAGWEETSVLVLRVRDTGIGIAEIDSARLFVRFEQADDATQRHFGGTGLGLAIVRQLVDLMGGEVRVNSRVGEGSTFEVRIPRSNITEP